MRVIVPLAGPDFIRADGSLKAMIQVDGKPLLRHVLNSRAWAQDVTDHTFVMMDRPETRKFASETLTQWYPNAHVTYLHRTTRGAALSALAALPEGTNFDAPLVIDLADILFTSTLDPAAQLKNKPQLGGIALTFPSQDPRYSYLNVDNEGQFIEAAEKRVISEHASAGVYVFRDTPTYLRALAHGMENAHTQAYRDLLFVCPLFNGVRDQGKKVELAPVTQVKDIKMET